MVSLDSLPSFRRGALHLSLVAVLLGAGLVGTGSAQAAPEAVEDLTRCAAPVIQDDIFGRYCYTLDGMQKLYSHLDGSFLGLTHGGDPLVLEEDPFADEGGAYTPGAPPYVSGGRYTAGAKAPHCVTDDSPDPLYYAEVIYARYQNEPDTYNDNVAHIRQLIREINGFLWDTTAELGQALQYKVKCDADGDITVAEAVLPASCTGPSCQSPCGAADCFTDITARLQGLGHNDPKVKYWVWTENTACGCGGKGTMYNDLTPGPANKNNGNVGTPMFAVSFHGPQGIRVMMHENGHNMGAVQKQPDPGNDKGSNNVGHCWDGTDIMCYGEDGEAKPYQNDICPTERWDCESDTYCNPRPQAGSYLDKNWNLCMLYNRYLVAGNGRPEAVDDGAVAVEDGPAVLIDVLADDTDPDGDTLYVHEIQDPPSGGTAVWNETTQRIVYTPGPDFFGKDIFEYKVRDRVEATNESLMLDTATITVDVSPVNDKPTAGNAKPDGTYGEQKYFVDEDLQLEILLKGTDVEGAPVAFEILSQPQKGTLHGTPPALVYTPAADIYDRDRFTFQTSDGELLSDVATVDINILPVNDPPAARDDLVIAFTEGAPHTLEILGNDDIKPDDLLAISSDDETFALQVEAFEGLPGQPGVYKTAAGGSFEVQKIDPDDPTKDVLLYTPPAGFETLVDGYDSILYRICDTDGSASMVGREPEPLCGTAQVKIDVVDSDVVAFPDTFATAEDTPMHLAAAESILSQDIWPDRDANGYDGLTVEVVAPPQGLLTLDAVTGALSYEPPTDFFGQDVFTYRFRYIGTDSEGQPLDAFSNTVTVRIAVTPVNDVPDPEDGAVTMFEDQAIMLLLAAVDVEDDLAGKDLSFSVEDGPAGDLSLEGALARYRPLPEFSGRDRFTFRVTDSDGASAVGTMDIEVLSVNDPPLARGDQFLLRPDQLNRVTAEGGLLINDDDPDGDAIFAQIVRAPDHGELVLGGDGGFSYVPASGFTGLDTFTYRALDVHDESSVVVPVGIDVQPNAQPVAIADVTVLDSGRPATTVEAGQSIVFASRAHDPDGDIVRWQWEANGIFLGDEARLVESFSDPGIKTITHTAWDRDGASASVEWVVDVAERLVVPGVTAPADARPVVTAQPSVQATAGSHVELRATTDAASVSWHWEQVGGPAVQASGTDTDRISFLAPAVAPGEARTYVSFTVRAFDGQLSSTPKTVTVLVLAQELAEAVQVEVPPGPFVVYGGETVTVVPTSDHEGAVFTWHQVSGAKVKLEGDDGALRFVAPHMADGFANHIFQVVATADGKETEAARVVVRIMGGVAPQGIAAQVRGGTVDLSPEVAGFVPPGMSFEWDLGDGRTANGTAIRHNYAPGAYTVTMTARHAQGYEREHTQTLVINEPAEAQDVRSSPVVQSDGGAPVGLILLAAGTVAFLAVAGVGLAAYMRRR